MALIEAASKRLTSRALMGRVTGALVDDVNHLKGSIIDILTTPLGTRVMLPDYGSRLLYLVDRPINALFLMDVYAAVIEALTKWEPRFLVANITANVENIANGQVIFDLKGFYLINGSPMTLQNLSVNLLRDSRYNLSPQSV